MSRRRRRTRGYIQELKSGSLRVFVYAGIDPLTGKRNYLNAVVPKGPDAAREAEKLRTKFLRQVDEQRQPRTNASVNLLLDRWLDVHKMDVSTRRERVRKIDKHIRPELGKLSLSKVGAETLETLYARLAACRDHCGGRRFVQHRTPRRHICDEHPDATCSPHDPNCRHCKRLCKVHKCKGLSDNSIRMIHSILSSAFGMAVRWEWISVNPVDAARQPAMPHSYPRPPSATEMASLINSAYGGDPEWGRFLWVKATSAERRGEMCAQRRSDYERDNRVLDVGRAIYEDDDGRLHEKDTKTHQRRRVVIDDDTADLIDEQIAFLRERARELGIELVEDPFIWSPAPDGGVPRRPQSVSQRFGRLAKRLGIRASIKDLRSYSATELIAAGVDMRTVAGRLGHGSGGATTMRAYAAWLSEADQRAAKTLSGRMPPWPGKRADGSGGAAGVETPLAPEEEPEPAGPYQRIARDLRGAIAAGILNPGDPVPSVKVLAVRYGVAPSTAHRAIGLLVELGLAEAARGKRTRVASDAS